MLAVRRGSRTFKSHPLAAISTHLTQNTARGRLTPSVGRILKARSERLKEVLMVFSGKKRSGEDRETVEEDMERLKPLHNFDLPCLKWGNQKLLRCMKVDSNTEMSVVDRKQSSENGGGSGSVMETRWRDSSANRRFRSSDDDHKMERSYYKFSSSEKLKARIGAAGDGDIEATREKLMFDFQKEVGKMKDAILREGLVYPEAAAAATTYSSAAERPWNLRTRRASCKVPLSPSKRVNRNDEVLKPNSSPIRNECKYLRVQPAGGIANVTTSGEKKERQKISVSLSRRELEEDFMAMAGRRLPRKPKKRPRIVQKKLDTLFPGLWLSEITADIYKVPDEAETRKR